MTGTSLHTKYRPTTLNEVVGQDHIKAPLQQLLSEGAQQAFLLEGPSGTGKTTLARICASTLGATEVIEVDAASNTGVDDMREVASRANFASLDGGGKAFIVDECHRLSKQAWESLLKAIEEPPEGVYWFFCTTEPTRVLPTIKTRCVTFSLKEVAYRLLLRLLSQIAISEELDVPEEVLDIAADEANGSPRQAIVNLATVKGATNEAEARAALNRLVGSAEAVDLARKLLRRTVDRKLLKELKDADPESVRMTVFHYCLAASWDGDKNALMILGEFEKPAITGNKMGDILLRCERLAWKWAK
jgi:DNA polymerase III gamma/tau subunit